MLRIIQLFVALLFVQLYANAQVGAENKTSHYVFPEFVKGLVKFKNGTTQTTLLNYNILTEEMVFDSNGVKLALVNVQQIDTVIIASRKFIPYEKVFYELLLNAPVALFMQHAGNVVSAGKPVGYGGTSQTSATTSVSSLSSNGQIYNLSLPEEFKVTPKNLFWVRKDKTFYKANNQRQVAKIFPEKEDEIKQFVKENDLDFRVPADVKKLVEFFNKK